MVEGRRFVYRGAPSETLYGLTFRIETQDNVLLLPRRRPSP